MDLMRSRQRCLVGPGRSRSLARGETRVGLQRGRFACSASRACPEPVRYKPGKAARVRNRCTLRPIAARASGGLDRRPVSEGQARAKAAEVSREAGWRTGRAGRTVKSAFRSIGGATGSGGFSDLDAGANLPTRSPRVACLRGSSQEGSCRRRHGPARQPSQARERPCVRSKAFSPGRSCQVCEQAGVHSQGDPVTDGRWERSGALCHGRSSEGSVNRLDGQDGIVGLIQPTQETPARPRAPGKMGSPIEITRAADSNGHARPESARSPGPTRQHRRERGPETSLFFCAPRDRVAVAFEAVA
jgi:hypothetical protein